MTSEAGLNETHRTDVYHPADAGNHPAHTISFYWLL